MKDGRSLLMGRLKVVAPLCGTKCCPTILTPGLVALLTSGACVQFTTANAHSYTFPYVRNKISHFICSFSFLLLFFHGDDENSNHRQITPRRPLSRVW